MGQKSAGEVLRAAHTPTPWRRDGSQVSWSGKDEKICVYVVGGKAAQYPTIFIESRVRTKKQADQFYANVDLIISATNSHTLTLAALKKARAALMNCGFSGKSKYGRGDPEINSIDKAIALAERGA